METLDLRNKHPKSLVSIKTKECDICFKVDELIDILYEAAKTKIRQQYPDRY